MAESHMFEEELLEEMVSCNRLNFKLLEKYFYWELVFMILIDNR